VTGAFGRSCPDLGDFPPPTWETFPDAVARNVAIARARTRARIMAVVKADGYGHGARTVAAGAEWLGTTDIAEASELGATGLTVPILTWLNPSGVDAEAAAANQIDIAIGSVDELEALLKHASSSVRVHFEFETEVVVKPVSAGSSYGVTLAREAGQLGEALHTAAHYDDRILIEHVVHGREIDVAVLREADGSRWAPPPLEIHADGLFDTATKYNGTARFTVPADLGSTDRAALTQAALRMFDALGDARLLAAVVRDLDEAGIIVDDLGLHRPTLDDVFLALAGRAAEPRENDTEKETA
jgi:hypothetical protein